MGYEEQEKRKEENTAKQRGEKQGKGRKCRKANGTEVRMVCWGKRSLFERPKNLTCKV